jgi:tetratricopeptide (TPR) repeat protein
MGQNLQEKNKLTQRIPRDGSLIFILFLAILGTYYASLPYPFLNLDDPFYISQNPYIRDLSWKGVYNIFSCPIVDNYFPLQIISYALDYQIWHVQPFGYRLHNVILHFLNAVLVFLLLKKIFVNPWVSFLAALLFGLHPVNVESVTWVAERKNVLSLAFTLFSFLAYLRYSEEPRVNRRRGFYSAALFLFSLALLAKASAVVLPPLLILYDFCFLQKGKWAMVKDKLPFLVLALLFSVLAVWIYRQGGYLAEYHGNSPYFTFLAMINVFVEYVIYLIAPVYLDHLYWTPIPQSFWERQVLLSVAAIFLMVLLAWRSFHRDRTFFFWFGWFFVSLLPVLNIVPLVILRADRYMYLPAIGFFYLVSCGVWKLSRGGYRPFGLSVFLFCSLLVAGSYASLTVERNRLWKDSILFWEETLKKYPQSMTPYKYIGAIYAQRGKFDLAISYYQTGLRENPDNVILLNGLALAYQGKKDLEKAEILLLRANRLHPADSATYNNLGTICFKKGDLERSKLYLEKALEMDPKNVPARTNLGVIFYKMNQWADAIREFEKAVELSPGSVEPYLNLALVHEKKGDWSKADSYLKTALDYAPESRPVLISLGRISVEQGKMAEAEYYFRKAYRISPNDQGAKHFPEKIARGEGNQDTPETVPPAQPKAIGALIHASPGGGRL